MSPATSKITSRLTRLAVLGLAVGLAACATKLDMSKISSAVSEGINSQLALPIASVACPQDSMVAKAGATFDCTATPKAGGKITVKITEKDDTGNIGWEVTKMEGILNLKAIEESVASGVKEQTGAEAHVDCGGRLRPAKAGDTFDCKVAEGDGNTVTALITVKDNDGNIKWELR